MREFGPCMCGDTHCHSCGPAQGNFQCGFCNEWADDGCAKATACEAAMKVMSKLHTKKYYDEEWGRVYFRGVGVGQESLCQSGW